MTEKRRSRKELHRQRESKKKNQKPPMKKWLKWTVLSILILFGAGFLFGAGLFVYYASSAPELNEELLKDPITAEFYDANGELFATIGVENRKYIEYEDIPQEMIDAILATEDVRFHKHFGIDFLRLGSAVIANFTGGFGSQGASTITQQVVKNSFLSNDKTLKRKAQEAWLAIQLEQQYEKEEIFEMYFNKILMSGNVYGFGTGADYFFGKELNELELDEIALLAGMPQSPNNYNPFKFPDRAQKRRDLVLDLMVQHGKITKAEADEAKKIEVASRILPEEERKGIAGMNFDPFLDVALSELEERGDIKLLAEGIKVYTTLDPRAQTTVEKIMYNPNNFPTETIESGIAVIDTKSGAIRAIGGGRNFKTRDWNYAHDLKLRPPGSTLKPIVAYGPAIEYLKWSTGKTLVDEPYTYLDGKTSIGNWDGKFFGPITVREALYASRNIPAVKTLHEVGEDRAKEFISKLGIQSDIVEADALGGGKVHISPIEMAAAYAAFGNNGVFNEPYSIKEIVFRDGSKKTYKREPVVAMHDYTAYMITDMLRDVVSTKPHASGSAAAVPGLDVAGKTGTTNYSADEFRKYNLPYTAVPDSWFVGYTTNYSIAVWSGYESRKDPITTWNERRLPQELFKKIMGEISQGKETKRFAKPNTVVEVTIEVGTEPLKLASEFTPNELRRTELFVRGTEPTEVSEEYEDMELEAPFNLKAVNHTPGIIDLSWDYNMPEEMEEGEEILFEVSVQVDDGEALVLTTTADQQVIVTDIESGRKYNFSVVAILGEMRSSPASTSIQIDGDVEDPDVEDPVPPEDPDLGEENEDGDHEGNDEHPPGQNENNGQNGGNNGNNENNGNGITDILDGFLNPVTPTNPNPPAEAS